MRFEVEVIPEGRVLIPQGTVEGVGQFLAVSDDDLGSVLRSIVEQQEKPVKAATRKPRKPRGPNKPKTVGTEAAPGKES